MIFVHAHTCSIDPAIVGTTGRRFLLESSGMWLSHSILCSLQANVCSREHPKVTWKGIWRYSGWMIKNFFSQQGIGAQQAMCLLVHYHEAETSVPANFVSLLPTCIMLAVQNFQIEMTTLCPGGTSSWHIKLLMPKSSDNFLTASHISSQCTL